MGLTMFKMTLLLFLFSNLLLASAYTPELNALISKAKTQVDGVTPEEATLMVKDGAILIDVRDSNEWDMSSLNTEGEVIKISRGLIEFEYVVKILSKHNKDDVYIVFCGHGPRAIFVALRMKELGFTNVTYLDGGMKSWVEKGFIVDEAF